MAYFLYNITDIDFTTASDKNCLSTVVRNGHNGFLEFLASRFKAEYDVSSSLYTASMGSCRTASSSSYVSSAGLLPVVYRNVWTLFFQSTHADTAETLLNLYNTDLEPMCTCINVCPSGYTAMKGSDVVSIYDCTVEHAGNFKKMADTLLLINGYRSTLIFADREKDILQYIKELKILVKCKYKNIMVQRYNDGYKKCRYFLSYEERMKCCGECRQKNCRDRLAGKYKNIFSMI